MKIPHVAFTVSLALLVATPYSAAFTRASFLVPPGWSELSPGAPGVRDPRFAPAAVARMTDGRFVASAYDLDHAADGYAENFVAMLRPLPHGSLTPIDDAWLDAVVRAMDPAMSRAPTIMAFRNLERRVVTLHGVHVGRLVNDATVNNVRMRQVMYFFPGVDEIAVVTYSARPGQFTEYVPVFDTAAGATKDLVEPPSRFDQMARVMVWIMAGQCVLGAVGLILGLALRKRR